MMRRWLPENVTAYKDRHGKVRYRFRKRGLPTYHFRFEPGTEEFRQEYNDAKSASAEPLPTFAPYTYDALISSFYRTPKWLGMRPSSQRTYRGIIERFRAKNGAKDVRKINAGSIDDKLGTLWKTPAAANNLRKTLSRLHRHATKLGWRKDNPVDATDPYPTGKGHHTWTEEEIAQFEAHWPLGTKERLAFSLLLYTALRLSDMLTIGRQHIRGGKLVLHHGKNDSDTVIPIIAPLAAAMGAVESEHLTFIVTEHGKPYTAKGFGNWFRRKCDKAQLKHCSAHGLRKAMARRLAESGATNQQGKAVTGQKSDRVFSYYAAKANQEAMAETAMANLEERVRQQGEKK